MNERKNSQANWIEHIRAYETSGLNKSAFCRENHLAAWAFRYHYKKYLSKSSAQEPSAPKFVEIKTPPAPQDFSLNFPNGIKISVPEYIDSKYLVKLIEVLRTC